MKRLSTTQKEQAKMNRLQLTYTVAKMWADRRKGNISGRGVEVAMRFVRMFGGAK